MFTCACLPVCECVCEGEGVTSPHPHRTRTRTAQGGPGACSRARARVCLCESVCVKEEGGHRTSPHPHRTAGTECSASADSAGSLRQDRCIRLAVLALLHALFQGTLCAALRCECAGVPTATGKAQTGAKANQSFGSAVPHLRDS